MSPQFTLWRRLCRIKLKTDILTHWPFGTRGKISVGYRLFFVLGACTGKALWNHSRRSAEKWLLCFAPQNNALRLAKRFQSTNRYFLLGARTDWDRGAK